MKSKHADSGILRTICNIMPSFLLWLHHSTNQYFYFCCHSYTTDEIHFNLMALVADKKKLYEKEVEELTERRDAAAQRVSFPRG